MAGRCEADIWLNLFCLDDDLDVRGDFAVQANRHEEVAERLEGLVEVDLAAVDVEALLFELLSDVGRGDRTEEVIVLAGLAGKGERNGVELRDERFGLGLF